LGSDGCSVGAIQDQTIVYTIGTVFAVGIRGMDLVFFRAAVLELHFSLPFEGERYVLVFANSKPLFECLKQQLDSVS